MKDWVHPQYSRSQITRSGVILRNSDDPFDEVEAMEALNNWKAAHELPLHYITRAVKKYANNVSKITTIVQRRKRTESILLKLKQQPKLDLARMQDLVGFRIVFRHNNPERNLARIDELVKIISESRMRSKSRITNYIVDPRESGYRSVHAIFKYNSSSYPGHNNMQVELQIRTKIQHIWATAVETVGMFERSHLKQGIGNENWLEFFRIMSQLMSIEEETSVATNQERKLIQKKLRVISTKIGASEQLSLIALQNAILQQAYNKIKARTKSNLGYMLLNLDLRKLNAYYNAPTPADRISLEKIITIDGFGKNEELRATGEYSRLEKEAHESSDVFVLLAKARDVKSLRKGFPNYFADISEFIAMHDKYCHQ